MNKKAKLELSTLIVIIVAILVILLLASLIFDNQILDWFKNLPGYEQNNTDRLIDELPEDVQAQLNYFKVALVQDGSSITFCTEGDCGKLRPSNLYWSGSEAKGTIYVAEDGFFGIDSLDLDDKVGVVSNGVVSVNNNILGGNNKPELPPRVDILNLHESIYISGILYKERGLDAQEVGKIDSERIDPELELNERLNGFFDSKIDVDGEDVSVETAIKSSLDPFFDIKNDKGENLIERYGLRVITEDHASVKNRMEVHGFGDKWDDFLDAYFSFQEGETVNGIARELENYCDEDRSDRYILQIPQGVIKDGGLRVNAAFNPNNAEFYTDPVVRKVNYRGEEFEVTLRLWRDCK